MKNSTTYFEPLFEQCESTSRLLKALAHPQRLQILCHLSNGEKTVTELETLCGASQSAVSQFLARMKAEQLIASRRDERYVFYRIADPKVSQLIKALHKIFCKSAG
ncbi:MAG: metalloregulator ArsR/SmtB family transcription factor [Gammaproteobacteria bacterium]